MAEEEFTRPKWQRLLLNRFVVVLGTLILLTLSWNLWVVTHQHGIVAGRVVDASGAPVEGAEVKLWVFNFATFDVGASTTTKPDGSFAFTKNPSHNIQLSAEKAGKGRSARVSIRLYFASEDDTLRRPLLLTGGT